MRALILENELLRVTILLDKGSDIVEFRYKPRDQDFLFFSPNGLLNPARATPPAASDATFLDYFSGGWNEILPNGGPSVTYKGAKLGQHGEVSLIPWKHAVIEDAPERVAARLWVRPIRTPFLVEKTLVLESGRAVLRIEEQLTNEAGEPLHLMWGQHIAFGRPFIEEGAVIDVPAAKIIVHEEIPDFEPRRFRPEAVATWPNVLAPNGHETDASCVPEYGGLRAQEMAYLTELREGWYAITNPVRRVGFGIRFDSSLYRYIWYWQQLGDVATGYPWWGRTHTVALEPWSSYPTNGLLEAISNGTALTLAAGEHIQTTLYAVAYEGFQRVTRIEPDGTIAGS
jgi:hypothetical protein